MAHNLARDAGNVCAAESLFALYEEYKLAGFTEDQAFDLICTTLHAGISSGVNR